jgi:MoxR-like ATPase
MSLPQIPDFVELDLPSSASASAPDSSGADSVPSERHVYYFDDPGNKARRAIYTALGANRPLLVRGEPGVGKTQLAEAAARALNRVFLSITVDSRTESRDLRYTFDAVRRLSEAQLLGALKVGPASELGSGSQTPTSGTAKTLPNRSALAGLRRQLDPRRFVVPGLLWWAFDWQSAQIQARRSRTSPLFTSADWQAAKGGAVLLIDEIDKAETEVPNGLLEPLGSRRFGVPAGLPDVMMQADNPPLVIITTNEERALPDPFLRRCVVLTLRLPDEVPTPSPGQTTASSRRTTSKRASATSEPKNPLVEFLVARGEAHFPSADNEVLRFAAKLIVADRTEARRSQTLLPGQAEFLDLIRAVLAAAPKKKGQIDRLEEFAEFVIRKQAST